MSEELAKQVHVNGRWVTLTTPGIDGVSDDLGLPQNLKVYASQSCNGCHGKGWVSYRRLDKPITREAPGNISATECRCAWEGYNKARAAARALQP